MIIVKSSGNANIAMNNSYQDALSSHLLVILKAKSNFTLHLQNKAKLTKCLIWKVH